MNWACPIWSGMWRQILSRNSWSDIMVCYRPPRETLGWKGNCASRITRDEPGKSPVRKQGALLSPAGRYRNSVISLSRLASLISNRVRLRVSTWKSAYLLGSRDPRYFEASLRLPQVRQRSEPANSPWWPNIEYLKK
jgi:hypothetical protein